MINDMSRYNYYNHKIHQQKIFTDKKQNVMEIRKNFREIGQAKQHFKISGCKVNKLNNYKLLHNREIQNYNCMLNSVCHFTVHLGHFSKHKARKKKKITISRQYTDH
uniref:Uncharacterized protein n=1 Tax=Rhizophora mucronata TaxID=61149 RepID=A0A2P2PR85_RHIMU